MRVFNRDMENRIAQVSMPEPSIIVFFGDSITFRSGGYVGIMEAMLTEHKNPAAAQVINAGVGGDTTDRALVRVDEVLSHRPTHVFIMLGINDSALEPETRVPRRPIEEYITDYRRIIELLEENGTAQIVLMTTTRVVPEWSGRQGWTEVLDRYNAEVRKLAKERYLKLVDVYEAWEKVNVKDLLNPDGVHPNIWGHKLIAMTILDFLVKLSSSA